jgi:hypothetical protein
MSGTSERVDPQRAALYLRVFGGDSGIAQLWFDQRVLDRYRAQPGTRVMRTNSVGRVRHVEGWQIDFGIAAADQLLHTTMQDLQRRLPSSERQHWAQHLVTPAVSRTFLTMRLAPGSCIEDGDLRDFASVADA